MRAWAAMGKRIMMKEQTRLELNISSLNWENWDNKRKTLLCDVDAHRNKHMVLNVGTLSGVLEGVVPINLLPFVHSQSSKEYLKLNV